MGWHGLIGSRIRYPLLANAVQRLLTVWWDKTVRHTAEMASNVAYSCKLDMVHRDPTAWLGM